MITQIEVLDSLVASFSHIKQYVMFANHWVLSTVIEELQC